MQVALLTVGDELLAGDTENTNATWLARRIAARGAAVERILVVPDDAAVIERYVREWADRFDAVVVTGGLGGTHDDITIDAVAAAFDRDLVVTEAVERDVAAHLERVREERPDLADYDIVVDPGDWAALPASARPLLNPVGLSPGCVVENVYVLPGVPEEMRAIFDLVASTFGGDVVTETLHTPAPEGSLADVVDTARERFAVTVGSYPRRGPDPNRLKVTGENADAVARAADWLREQVETVDPDA